MIQPPKSKAVQPVAGAGTASSLVVQRVRDLAQLEPWISHWDALAERAAPGRPMCSGSWVAAWLEVRPPGAPTFEVALASRGERLVGAWPFVVRHRWPLHVVPPSDLHTFTGGPVLDPDEDPGAILGALLDGGLARRAHRASVLGVVEGDPLHQTLARAMLKGWTPIVRKARFRGARLGTDTPFDVPWRSLSSKSRQRLKLARRRLGELGALEHRVDEGEAALASLETFLALEAATWKGRDTSAIATDAHAKAFYLAWGRRLAARSWLRVSWTTVAGRPVASELCVLFAGTLFVQKITFAEDVARESPGHVRWAETVAWACEREDVHAIDTIGCDDIRLRWGCTPYEYVHVHFVRRGILPTLLTRWPLALRARLARWRHGDAPSAGGDAGGDTAEA
ncbi:MAG: GNAT family N-acetyltransferase [Planctomycetota bacterium]